MHDRNLKKTNAEINDYIFKNFIKTI